MPFIATFTAFAEPNPPGLSLPAVEADLNSVKPLIKTMHTNICLYWHLMNMKAGKQGKKVAGWLQNILEIILKALA